MSNLSHMRSIGVGTYTTNQKIVDGEVKDDNRNQSPRTSYCCGLQERMGRQLASNDWRTIHRRHEFLKET